MSASSPAPRGARVSRWLETATRLFGATLLKCLPLGMLAFLCWRLPSFYWQASGHHMSIQAYHDPAFNLLTLFGMTLELWLVGALMLRQRAMARGIPLDAIAALQAAARRLPSLLIGTLLATLSIVVGLLLLVIPGVYLAICYLLVWLPVVLIDGLGPYASLLRSVRLLRPLWGQALAALVIAVLIFFIGAIVYAAIIQALAGVLPSDGAALAAIEAAGTVLFGALFVVYLSALQLVLHSAASSSA
jgi:hypothetical protein